ncbi:MAG: phosphatase PAP2 family protein [Eubacteriales bacterium]|nr:phosphatase PAP2 family protein [Eubacteriales bacterium]
MKASRSKKAFWKKWLPPWAILPLVSILAVNCLVYWGSGILTGSCYHYDFTTDLDRMVPLAPEFVWIYILAFPFWACNYILAAQRGKDGFYRFAATDLAVHAACFVVFLLIPTTNIRPQLAGDTLSEKMLMLIYELDGGNHPSNLFPSIHCYVSWLCWRGLKGAKEIPGWYQHFSLVFAVLIIISTQVLKQHYLVDAVAAVALVEIFWRFFSKGNRRRKVMRFFEHG